MATSVIEKLLVNIEANAAQLQAELAKAGKSTQDFGRTTSAMAKGADGIGQRYSVAAVQIASAAENMARAGKLGGEGLKQIIVQGSNMAFMFGAQGAVVGAVGIASLAIIEYFRKTEDETRKVVEEVRRLAQAARGAAADAASSRLTSIDAEIARLRSEIEDLEGKKAKAGGVLGRTGLQAEIEERRRSLTERERDRELAQNQLQQETQRLQAEELRNLQSLLRANAASTEETNRAKAIESALRAELRQTNLTLQRRVEILSLLGELDAKPRKAASAARDDGTAAAIAAANAQLDALRKRQEDNAETIAAAVQNATRDLASLAGDTAAVLALQIDEVTRKFRALGATDRDIEQIVAPLEAARKAAVALNGAARTITIPDSVRRELGLLPQELQSGIEGAADASVSFADGLSDALDVAAGLVTALDGAGSSMARLISGAAQAASGIAQLSKLASEAGGLGQLFSTGSGLASALPGIGAVIAGIGGLVGALRQEDPAARALREALDRNARRLEEFTSAVGDLVQISIGGADAAAVRDLPITQLQQVGLDPLSGEPVFQDVRKSSKELIEDLRGVGVSLKELQQLAADFGMSFANAEWPTADEIRDLQLLIAANGLKKLTDSLTGQLKLLELQARIDPEAFAGIQGVIQRIGVLTGDKGVPALRDALAGIDLTTTDGPAQAIARLKQLLADFTAGKIDLAALGGLSPEDFAEAIAQIIESIRDAAPELRAPADKFRDAIEAFGVAVELGTMTAEERLAKAKDLFASLFPDLAASVDTSSVEAFKSSIQRIIDGFAADGELTEAEQAQIAVLRLMIEAFDDASAAAEDIAQKAEAAMLAARALVFSLADAIIAVNDISDPVEILKIRAAALVKAFPELSDVMAQFDLSTQEGRDALEAWIQSLIASPDALAAMAKELGISVDDLLGRLLGLESAADDAAVAVETLADKLGAAFDSAEFDLELEGITDPLEKLKRTSAAIGDVLPDIADIFKQFDVATEEGRAGAEAALIALAKSTDDAAVRSAVLKLLGQIRGIKGDETAPAAGLAGGGGGGGGRDNVRATAAITEVTANRLVDLFGRNVVATEQMRDTLAAALGRTLALPGAIAPPALPSLLPGPSAASAGGAGAGAVVLQLTLPQIVFNGPVTTANEAELARLIQSRFMDLIQSQLTTELLVAIRRAGVARSN